MYGKNPVNFTFTGQFFGGPMSNLDTGVKSIGGTRRGGGLNPHPPHRLSQKPYLSLKDPKRMEKKSITQPKPKRPQVQSQRIPVPILPT